MVLPPVLRTRATYGAPVPVVMILANPRPGKRAAAASFRRDVRALDQLAIAHDLVLDVAAERRRALGHQLDALRGQALGDLGALQEGHDLGVVAAADLGPG